MFHVPAKLLKEAEPVRDPADVNRDNAPGAVKPSPPRLLCLLKKSGRLPIRRRPLLRDQVQNPQNTRSMALGARLVGMIFGR